MVKDYTYTLYTIISIINDSDNRTKLIEFFTVQYNSQKTNFGEISHLTMAVCNLRQVSEDHDVEALMYVISTLMECIT